MNLRIPLVVLALASVAFAQGPRPLVSGKGPWSHLGLVDLSKISLQHAVGFGYTTVGGRSEARGLFATTVGYALTPALHVRATLGAQTRLGSGQGGEQRVGISSVEVAWRPSPSFFLGLSYTASPLPQVPRVDP